MRLAVLQHIRCGSYEDTTRVWIPDSMDTYTLNAYIDMAQQKYFEHEKNFSGMAKPADPGYGPSYSAPENAGKTIGEVKDSYEIKRAEYDKWTACRDAARKDFSVLLADVSEGKIIALWKHQDLEIKVNWGHNHGITIEVGSDEAPENENSANAETV